MEGHIIVMMCYTCYYNVEKNHLHCDDWMLSDVNVSVTIITAAQNEVTLGYHRVRVLYFSAVIFGTTIIT